MAALAWLPAVAPAQAPTAPAWSRANADLRMGFETVKLPGNEHMGLLGTSYLLELRPGLCVGPAVYGAASGQHGGLFTLGAEAALCTPLAGRLSLEAGLYVGGGGGGGAPVGSGLMLRPHADLLWDFGGYRLGVSVSNVRFPSGQINSSQIGVVFGMDTEFTYLPAGTGGLPFQGAGRTGIGIDRMLMVGGAYRPRSGSKSKSGVPLASQIGYVGARAERFFTPMFFGGLESNAAASHGAAGYAELLGTLGAQWSAEPWTFGGRLALGMGGGGDVAVGGGLLGKAAVDAAVRLSRNISLNLEAGWAWAPQGSFSAPFGALALRWDLDHPQGQPSRLTRQEWLTGIEGYQQAARKLGPPQSLQNVTLKFNRFLDGRFYLTGQVQSAYAGNAGGYAAGLLGVGARLPLGAHVQVGAELLAGAGGGGGVDTGDGAIAQPIAYAAVDLTPALSLRLGAGRVKAFNGALDSAVFDVTLAFAFDVASRP